MATSKRKPAKKPPAKKPAKKKAVKKPVKKTAGKTAAKNPAAKPAKKSVKKAPVKKAVKKTVKKATKKKAVKKAAVKKKTAAKKPPAAPVKKKAAKTPAKKPAKKPAAKKPRPSRAPVAWKPPAKKKTSKKKSAAKKTPAARVSTHHLPSLLGRFEPPPYRVENLRAGSNCLIVCDHASNVVPRALKNLGLSRADLKKHVAWDPGTANIGRSVARSLDATAIYASYSRLVVDLNRGADSEECMREESDGIRIPGNAGLTPAKRSQRLEEIFDPYHKQIDAQLDRIASRGKTPMLVSIHSFTPAMGGVKRPWEIGVLWNKEEKLARKLVENLRENNPGLRVGENEPYSLKDENVTKNTISTHAEARGLPYIILEFRQDLVGSRLGARKWANIFLESLRPLLDEAESLRATKKRARG